MRRREGGRRSWRPRGREGGSVNLISMMDVLTVLLLFLLKSYSTEGQGVLPPAGVLLPTSTAQLPPQPSLVVAIDDDDILLGDQRVATVHEAEASGDPGVPALAERLAAQRQAERASGAPLARTATIQGDRDIEFRVLKRVMLTLTESGYEDVSLAVFQKS
jgi:biopolymer transport protein TolR